jgi:kinetochore protein Mis13/DSN1
MPHADVETSRFYTHIETGLPEPRRMRQLLTWCATRALLEKPRPADQKSDTETLAIESGELVRQQDDRADASKRGKYNSS